MIDAQYFCPKCGGAVRVETPPASETPPSESLLQKIFPRRRKVYAQCRLCGWKTKLK